VEGAFLCGFAESGKRWYDVLSTFLVDSGYSQSVVDPCVFLRVGSVFGEDYVLPSRGWHILCLHGQGKALTSEFLLKVESRFGKVKHKDGNIIPFLGLRLEGCHRENIS
jgi:hypothetical protein